MNTKSMMKKTKKFAAKLVVVAAILYLGAIAASVLITTAIVKN